MEGLLSTGPIPSSLKVYTDFKKPSSLIKDYKIQNIVIFGWGRDLIFFWLLAYADLPHPDITRFEFKICIFLKYLTFCFVSSSFSPS